MDKKILEETIKTIKATSVDSLYVRTNYSDYDRWVLVEDVEYIIRKKMLQDKKQTG